DYYCSSYAGSKILLF
nr:immunoglobulin light chain junction region [Macaca mulatta]